jgi:hypothetical protein
LKLQATIFNNKTGKISYDFFWFEALDLNLCYTEAGTPANETLWKTIDFEESANNGYVSTMFCNETSFILEFD